MKPRFIAVRVRLANPDLPRGGHGTSLFEWFPAGYVGYVGYRPLPTTSTNRDGVVLVVEALFDECDQALRAKEFVEGHSQGIHARDV